MTTDLTQKIQEERKRHIGKQCWANRNGQVIWPLLKTWYIYEHSPNFVRIQHFKNISHMHTVFVFIRSENFPSAEGLAKNILGWFWNTEHRAFMVLCRSTRYFRNLSPSQYRTIFSLDIFSTFLCCYSVFCDFIAIFSVSISVFPATVHLNAKIQLK